MSSKIAYIVGHYPAVSHTFVQREVRHLRELGRNVSTFSVHQASPESILSADDADSFRTTTALRPTSIVRLLSAHLQAIVRSPRAYASTLRIALRRGRRSPKRTVWQFFYFLEAMLMWSACRRQNIRHIHAHLANVASDVARLAAEFGKQSGEHWTWSFTMHGPTEFANVEKFGLRDKVIDAQFIICISDFCRSQLMALVSDEHWAKMRIAHCGVEVERFAYLPKATTRTPANILCVGRLVPEKGQLLLLDAVDALKKQNADVRATFVGRGPDLDRLRARTNELGLSDVVNIPGAIGQDEILDYYRDADVFVLPSAAEGVPVVLMEAMSLGIPVISTNITGIPELITNGTSGRLVPPGRVDLLAGAIQSVLSNDNKRKAMCDAARATIESDFDIRECAREIDKIFNEFVG
jgi:colanic acid/amylovoran biosynthesis glycosyltransferase